MLFGNVELRATLTGGTFFSQRRHKFVKIGLELFLDTIGPLVFAMQLGNIFIVHFIKEVVQWISIDLPGHYLVVNPCYDHRLFPAPFDEVRNLILFGSHGVFYSHNEILGKLTEFWSGIEAILDLTRHVKPYEKFNIVRVFQKVEEFVELLVRNFANLKLVEFHQSFKHPLDS